MFISMQKKSTTSLSSFLRYCKDNTSFQYWILWAHLAMNDTVSLKKTLMLIFMEKIIFIPHLFFEILQRYCKIVIFGTLGMSCHSQHK